MIIFMVSTPIVCVHENTSIIIFIISNMITMICNKTQIVYHFDNSHILRVTINDDIITTKYPLRCSHTQLLLDEKIHTSQD